MRPTAGGLCIEIDTNLPGPRIVRVLDELVERSLAACRDNGPEFLSKSFTDWCQAKGIKILYTPAGKPYQNALIERLIAAFATRCSRLTSSLYLTESLRRCVFR
jgi:transposase InsO family protein